MFRFLVTPECKTLEGQSGRLKANILARLDDYLQPFATNQPKDKLYIATHQAGEKRARRYREIIDSFCGSENALAQKIFLDAYNYDPSAQLGTSKVMRHYLQEVLCDYLQIDKKALKKVQDQAIYDVAVAYKGSDLYSRTEKASFLAALEYVKNVMQQKGLLPSSPDQAAVTTNEADIVLTPLLSKKFPSYQ